MKTTKILTILVLAFGLIVCLPKVGQAEPMGTAWTYQGRLIDANVPADGLYDLQFKLYDANVGGSRKGGDVNIPDLDIIDGYFTVELDFGSNVFNGDARWLQIGVRPGDLNDPNKYTILTPRYEVTPAPYALQTRGLFVNNVLNVGIGTTNPNAKFHARYQGNTNPTGPGGTWAAKVENTQDSAGYNGLMVANRWGGPASTIFEVASYWSGGAEVYTPAFTVKGDRNVGIGTTNPGTKLEVSGDGDQRITLKSTSGVGVQLIASANYDALIRTSTNHPLYLGANNGWSICLPSSGNVGIGTSSPQSPLHILGGNWDLTNSEGDFKIGNSDYRLKIGVATGGTGAGNVYMRAVGGSSALMLGSGTSNVMTIKNDNVGIGTAPNHKLDVHTSGDIAVYGLASNSGDVSNYGGMFIADGKNGCGIYGQAPGSNGRGVSAQASGSNGYGVYSHGGQYDFYASGPGTNYGAASSIRWKTDIQPIDNPLDKVTSIRGVYFNWDAEHGGQHDVGMVAEEVGQVLPEIVEYEENGIDATGMDYSKLTPLLVEAVKALKTELDDLRKENTNLRNRVESMEKMMTDGSMLQIGVK